MKLFLISICILTTIVCDVAQATIAISSSNVSADASDGVGQFQSSYLNSTTIYSTSTPIQATAIDGNASSTTTIDWYTLGTQTTLSFAMEHQRPGTQFAFSQTRSDTVVFTANDSVAYQLAGFYNVMDAGTTGNYVVQEVTLRELNGGNLFRGINDSRSTPNEQFVLGVAGGDTNSLIEGSLMGTLSAGHTYELFIDNYISSFPNSGDAASAVGNVTLTMTQLSTVPEPSAFLFGGLVSAVLAVRLWAKQKSSISNYCSKPQVVD